MGPWPPSHAAPAEFECELVLRGDDEFRMVHSFLVVVGSGTCIRMQGRDWTVVEVHERGRKRPEVICSPSEDHMDATG